MLEVLPASDVGFDLRTVGTPIMRPDGIGYPGQLIEVRFDGTNGVVTMKDRAMDCGAALRRAGYTVDKSWFAGRTDWGRLLAITTAASEQAVFKLAGELEDAARTQD